MDFHKSHGRKLTSKEAEKHSPTYLLGVFRSQQFVYRANEAVLGNVALEGGTTTNIMHAKSH